MRFRAGAGLVAALLLVMIGGAVSAQEKVTLRSDILLYGDNTEFRNPFREGETIFGAVARLYGEFELNPRVVISLGALGNQRFGSKKAFEQARPVIALTARGRRSTFILGTLPARTVDRPLGPDRSGPHGLLPPLQRETLTFERPYEAGLQWDLRTARLAHSTWLEWQRLNTSEHRERFDAGLNARILLAPSACAARPDAAQRVSPASGCSGFTIPVQVHVVHEGGQLFASGPVHDSAAAALGLAYEAHVSRARVAMDAFGLRAKSVPDRQQPERDRTGRAFFARIAVERGDWRAHAIAWRGSRFIKDEGDPNYLSIRRDGRVYGRIRDYAEAGLARRITLAPGAAIEVSGRLHRTERNYEYSYRVLGSASLRWVLHP